MDILRVQSVYAGDVIGFSLMLFELKLGLEEGESVSVSGEPAGDPTSGDFYLSVVSDDFEFSGSVLNFESIGVAFDDDVDLAGEDGDGGVAEDVMFSQKAFLTEQKLG